MKYSVFLLSILVMSCSHHGHHSGHHKNGDGKMCHHRQKGVYFISPKDGETVAQKFTVRFGVDGMQVRPAGELIESTGHHHLIVNDKFVEKGQVVGRDETHLHFGLGQSETELKLKPGKHTLTLQFADGAHMSYGDKWSQTISIDVK